MYVLFHVLTLMSLTKAGVQVSSASVCSFWRSANEGLMVTEWLPSCGSSASLYLCTLVPNMYRNGMTYADHTGTLALTSNNETVA